MRILSCFWFCFAFGFFSGQGQTSFDVVVVDWLLGWLVWFSFVMRETRKNRGAYSVCETCQREGTA